MRDTPDKNPCPVIGRVCENYTYQCDSNGEVAICHCTHPENESEFEGNCTRDRCPIWNIEEANACILIHERRETELIQLLSRLDRTVWEAKGAVQNLGNVVDIAKWSLR